MKGLKQVVWGLVVAVGVVSGCAVQSPSAPSASDKQACAPSDNMLINPDFALYDAEQQKMIWQQVQHARKSFELTVTDGVAHIEQIANEPWYILRQTVQDPRLPGATVRFSVDTRANLIAEPPVHGWEHKGGIYYAAARGKRSYASSAAEQTPNVGEWDWQEMSATWTVPEDATGVIVGIYHQADGWIEAKNPSLTIVSCPE